VGTGANRAGLVIDWVEDRDEPAALVWGFRWNGDANGRDMLLAVLTADDRLFAKLGTSPMEPDNPDRVFGIGYDANNDAAFRLDDPTPFDSAGIAITAPADGASSTDDGDHYAEGWFAGLWHYGIATGNPFDGGSWMSSPQGMVDRELIDEAWDSWAFTSDFDFTAFATNPVATVPPMTIPGDYNGDEIVDALDYDLWASVFGETGASATDGNGNGIIDAADYTVWRDHLDATAAQITNDLHAVPEPNAAPFLFGWFIFSNLARNKTSKQKFTKAAKEERSIKRPLAIIHCVLCGLLLNSSW
jgi:hypothetical protein